MPPMVRLFMVPEAAAGNAIGNRLRQRLQQHVDNALRSFDIATGDRRGRSGVDHGSGWSDDADRTHQAGGGGHVLAQQAAEDVEARRVRDRLDGVDRALNLRVAAGEVDGDKAGAFPARGRLFYGWCRVDDGRSRRCARACRRRHRRRESLRRGSGPAEWCAGKRASFLPSSRADRRRPCWARARP